MKKLIALLLAAVMLLCAAAALAAEPVDLSTYTDAELDALRVQVAEEIAARRRAATASPAADFRYVSNGTEVRIVEYVGNGGDVVIPDMLDGVPVTQIGERAFYDKEIVSLQLPAGLISLGDTSVGWNFDWKGVLVLPETVQSIEWGAFYGTGLQGIVIQSSCKIQASAFFHSLSDFCYIREGCAVSIGRGAFDSGIKTIVIPADVKVISAGAFEGCQKLTVYCPAGSYAEQYCRENFIVCNTAEYEAMVAYYEALYPAQ